MALINDVEIHAEIASMSYIVHVSSDHKDINELKFRVKVKSPRNYQYALKQLKRLAKSDMFLDSVLWLHKSGVIEVPKSDLKRIILYWFPDNFDAIRKLKEYNAK